MGVVGANKGRITSRVKGRSKGEERVQRLIEEHVNCHIKERWAMVSEWQTLVKAGVSRFAICEEYKIGNQSLGDALRDPETWCKVRPYGERIDKARSKTIRKRKLKQIRRR